MPSDHQNILDYLEGEGSAESRAQMENAAKADAELAAELAAMQQTQDAMRHWALSQAAQRAEATWQSEQAAVADPKTKRPSLGMVRRWMAVAAAAAVLGIVVWWALGIDGNKPVYEAFTERSFYAPYTQRIADEALEGQGYSAPNPVLKEGITQFGQGDYTKVVQTLSPLAKDPTAALYLGLSHQELGQNKAAFEHFLTAQQSTNNLVQQYAQWSIAIAYLHNNQKQEAKTYLNALLTNPDLPINNANLYEQAQRLLEELR